MREKWDLGLDHSLLYSLQQLKEQASFHLQMYAQKNKKVTNLSMEINHDE